MFQPAICPPRIITLRLSTYPIGNGFRVTAYANSFGILQFENPQIAKRKYPRRGTLTAAGHQRAEQAEGVVGFTLRASSSSARLVLLSSRRGIPTTMRNRMFRERRTRSKRAANARAMSQPIDTDLCSDSRSRYAFEFYRTIMQLGSRSDARAVHVASRRSRAFLSRRPAFIAPPLNAARLRLRGGKKRRPSER